METKTRKAGSRGTVRPLSEWKNVKAAWAVVLNGCYFTGGNYGFSPKAQNAMQYTEQEAKAKASELSKQLRNPIVALELPPTTKMSAGGFPLYLTYDRNGQPIYVSIPEK